MANTREVPMRTIVLKKALKSFAGILCVAIAFFLLTLPAYAEILLGVTRTSASIYGGSNYSVDWNGASPGGTTKYFQTTEANTKVVISFNAECAVMTAGSQKWVGIDIIVDPAGNTGPTVASPSNSDNALCSGNSTANSINGYGDGWISAMTQAIIVLPQAGQHSVKVRVKGQYSGIARLDDMSLLVQR